MQVSINEKPVPVNFSHIRNLEEALAELNDRFVPPGEQVFQIRVNGEFFSERYPRESRYVSLKEINTLEITTIPDTQMARVILAEAGVQAGVLCQAIAQSARLFRVASEEEANHYFAQVLEALRWLLLTGEHACRVLQVDLVKALPPNGEPESHYLKRMQDLLEEMGEIHEDLDYVLLADLMEYELLPMVREWQEVLENLARQ
uniref:DUF8043 domain-containing protein n=1 Tax=Desulfobacca acetoxidans TaxID=60893 RepID=A0A7C5AL43_9BACT